MVSLIPLLPYFSEFTDELAQAQAFILLVAAVEPSSITLMHLAYDLAQSPDCQNKARQEIKAQLQKYGGYSWECVKDMKYLNCCLRGNSCRNH